MNYSLIPDLNSIDDALALSKSYNLCFEYNEFTKPEVYSDAKEIERIINTYKLLDRDRSNDTMHGTFLGIDVAAIDPIIRNRSQELCKLSMEIAQRLSIKGVVFHTGLLGLLRVQYYIDNWLNDAEGFFGKLCEDYPDIFIYMENSFEQEPDVFIELMKRMSRYPNFKLCLDYGHAILTSTEVEKWIEAFAPYIGHMHLNDNDLKDDLHLPVGDGKIDFYKWKKLTEKYNINTSALLEMNGYDKVEKSIKHLSQITNGTGTQKTVNENKLQKILDIGITLSKERDPNTLLSDILDSAMALTNCDGGSLYILKEDGLHFAVMKTISKGVNRVLAEQFFSLDNKPVDGADVLPPIPLKEANVCAYSAIHKKSLNIPDVYDSELFDFSGPKNYDAKNNYRTKSMVAIPMINHRNEVIGVMQLLNAMDEDGNTIAFSEENEHIISSLASQTAICLSNMTYLREMDRQIWSFTEAMTEVIDMRTPYNGNHTKNVAKYAGMMADYINELHDKGEEELCFSEEHVAQMVMAAYLHDIGKMTIPCRIMNKQTRLENHIERIVARLENSKLKNEISYLKGETEKADYEMKADELDRAIKLANDVNTDKPLSDEIEAEIDALSSYFTDEEVDCMRIKRGTLTASERQIMEDHVVVTKKILDKVYFNRNYAKAPKWAAEHHECVDGSGYPNKIAGESLCIESRILAVADITDALLATDRPYKKPIPKDKAFMIMKDMAKSGKLDPKLVGYMEQCLK